MALVQVKIYSEFRRVVNKTPTFMLNILFYARATWLVWKVHNLSYNSNDA
jgi:hypothetical protein